MGRVEEVVYYGNYDALLWFSVLKVTIFSAGGGVCDSVNVYGVNRLGSLHSSLSRQL